MGCLGSAPARRCSSSGVVPPTRRCIIQSTRQQPAVQPGSRWPLARCGLDCQPSGRRPGGNSPGESGGSGCGGSRAGPPSCVLRGRPGDFGQGHGVPAVPVLAGCPWRLPAACCRASWQLPGSGFRRRAATGLRALRSTVSYVTVPPPALPGARDRLSSFSPESLRTWPAGVLNAIAPAVLPVKWPAPARRPCGHVASGLRRDAGLGNAGEGHPRPSAYVCLRQQASGACRARHGHRRPARARRGIVRPPFDMKELGEIDMVSRAPATLGLVTPRRRVAGIPGGAPRRSCRTARRHWVLVAAAFRGLPG
jgi:hypothetical protein